MNDKPVFDPDRDRAIRAMIVENARAEKARPSLRTRASLLIGLVIAALLVSGGGVAMALTGIIQIPVAAPAPVETATSTPTPTQTTAPAPPPAPEPTPTATTVDVSSWVVTFDGVGPIVFGGPITDASAALDTTALVPFDFGVEGCTTDKRDVAENTRAFLSVDADESGAVDLIAVSNYAKDDGTQDPAALPSTAEGISPGSSEAELLAAYPGITPSDSVVYDRAYVLSDPSGHRLWFFVDSATDHVVSVVVSDDDSYQLGGCGA